jgi:hypothetical protein
MTEISNRTLALVLIASIVISFSGTMISLYKLSSYQNQNFLTGLVGGTQTGQVNLTVQSNLGINLLVNFVDFGTGYINGSLTTCTMNPVNLTTEGTYGTNTNNCWINSSGIIGTTATSFFKPFVVNNDGTINATLSLGGKSNTTLLGGTANESKA